MKNKKIAFSIGQLDFFRSSEPEEIEEVFLNSIGIRIEHLGVFVFAILFIPVFSIASFILGDINIFLRMVITIAVFTIIHFLVIVILINTFIRYQLEKNMHTKEDDLKS